MVASICRDVLKICSFVSDMYQYFWLCFIKNVKKKRCSRATVVAAAATETEITIRYTHFEMDEASEFQSFS